MSEKSFIACKVGNAAGMTTPLAPPLPERNRVGRGGVPGSPEARSPRTTPSRSAALRFWLNLRLPSRRAIGRRQPDDALELRLHEGLGRVVDRPGLGSPGLVALGQPGDDGAQAVRVVEELRRAVGVDRGVVPRRHHPPVLGFGRVPARRDVGVGPREDRQRLARRREPPLRVGAGDVAVERPERALVGREEKGSGVPTSPSPVMVTSVARPAASIMAWTEARSSSRKAGGVYIGRPSATRLHRGSRRTGRVQRLA